MRTGINPKVDCVFKAIFGSEENKDVLIHLLNAVLDPAPEHRIASVELLNPYNDRTFEDGKSSVVDIKAKDQLDRILQIEIQIQVHPGLEERMLWTWTDIYHRQLQAGQSYELLNPTISIWFLDESLFKVKNQYHHCFAVMERSRQEILSPHFNLHVIEMKKWISALTIRTKADSDIDLWLKFLNYGQDLESEKLPPELRIPEIQKAMSTLTRFSQSDKEHDLYMRRMERLSIDNSWKEGVAKAERRAELEAQRAEKAEKERNDEAKRAEKAERERNDEAKRAESEAKRAESEAVRALKAERELAELKNALAEAQKTQKSN